MIIVLYESVFKNKIFCSDFDAALNISYELMYIDISSNPVPET